MLVKQQEPKPRCRAKARAAKHRRPSYCYIARASSSEVKEATAERSCGRKRQRSGAVERSEGDRCRKGLAVRLP